MNNNSTNIESNLNQLWGVLILHKIDKFSFLISCPLIFFAQVVVCITYIRHKELRENPGIIFFGIVVIELALNLHLLANAIFRTIFSYKDQMPQSFIHFCLAMGIIETFFSMLHFLYLILFMFHTIFLFRFSLKKKSNVFWSMLQVFVLVGSLAITIFCYFEEFMGLGFYGICGITETRKIAWNPTIPSIEIICSLMFTFLGFFTFFYFKKHMPGGQVFQRRKIQEGKIIFMYVTGFSLIEIFMSIMSLILEMNCLSSTPLPELNVLITIVNIFRLLEFVFLIFLIMFNERFRIKFKHTLRSIFTKNCWCMTPSKENENVEFEDLLYNEKLLDIKEKSNEIDLLLLSQIYTIISGIYITYFEYFKELKPDLKVTNINFRERITFSINHESVRSYETEVRFMIKLRILSCDIVIHSPKVFEYFLNMDKIKEVFNSFSLVDNLKKLPNVTEGTGGRSGEFFFFSADNKYVLKTIPEQEFEFFNTNLENFYDYFQKHKKSLLSKIIGLFTIKGDEMQRKYHLILMKNIKGCKDEQVLKKYDLKGSKYDRQVIFENTEINDALTITLKDVDFITFEERLHISPEACSEIRNILREDTIFLKNMNLLDYSLLIVKVNWEIEPEDSEFWGELQRIPHETEKKVYYHICLIDYMQKWDLNKKSEKWWKNLMGKKDVSAEEPNQYQKRFTQLVEEITKNIKKVDDSDVELREIEKQGQSKSLINPLPQQGPENDKQEETYSKERGITNKI